MTLQQLRYILKIVECGSLNEAAKQLYITQPSLSSVVQELEQEFGIEILRRSARGVSLTVDGAEFLSYAKQVMEQSDLMEQRYKAQNPTRRLLAVSTQHYAFAVNAFVNLLVRVGGDEYEFTLRETRTHDIIEDVGSYRSEVGILYLNEFNEKVMRKIFRERHLRFHPLFEAAPHVFISAKNPLAARERVSLADLEPYPCLSFEQGEFNSFFFSEEILSTAYHRKEIHVSDRATLFNLVIGLNGYTISTGVLSSDLNGENIIAVPLDVPEKILVGWIANEKAVLSRMARDYIHELEQLIEAYGFRILP